MDFSWRDKFLLLWAGRVLIQCLKFVLLQISGVVLLQLGTGALLNDAGWLKIFLVAYFFGSFLNHNLFLAIHELSHNLAFSTPVYNRWLGIFANLPIGVPMSVTFQKYHLEHHRFQGVDGIDMDVPSLTEVRLVKNIIAKTIWVFLQLFFYALRPLFLKPKPPGIWEFINFSVQIALDVYGNIYSALLDFLFIRLKGPTVRSIMNTMISQEFLETSFTGFSLHSAKRSNCSIHNVHVNDLAPRSVGC